MPGLDIAAIMATVGQMLLQSLMNALTNTITQLLTNAITGALNSLADAIGDLGTGLSWVEDAVRTFTDNLATELTGVVSDLTNNVNLFAQHTLGVIDAQQRLHEQLVEIEKGTLDYLIQSVNQEQQHRQEVGAAVTSLLLEYVSHRGANVEQFVRDYYDKVLGKPLGDSGIIGDWTEEALTQLTKYVMTDLEFVESLAPEQLAAAQNTVAEIVKENDRWFREWFLEIVVKPITNFNAMYQAMQRAFQMSPEEFRNQLELVETVTTEYYQKKAKELARQLGEGGAEGEVFTPR